MFFSDKKCEVGAMQSQLELARGVLAAVTDPTRRAYIEAQIAKQQY